MYTFVYEYEIYYEFIVTDGTNQNSFVFQFGKDQDIDISIAESVLLAQHEINNRNIIPVAV